MAVDTIHDRSAIERWLRRDPWRHIYELGDLDPFYWPHTTWLTHHSLDALALVYRGAETVLLLLRDDAAAADLLRRLVGHIPATCYAHLAPGLVPVAREIFEVTTSGDHTKMGLVEPGRLAEVDSRGISYLAEADLDALRTFYALAYPGNWFDPRMIQTGQYVGLRDDDDVLVAAAGVHVFSPAQRVAALGNIATHPAHRGRGYARQATAALCRGLLARVDHIGLNVASDNVAALRCYAGLGFAPVADYVEATLTTLSQRV